VPRAAIPTEEHDRNIPRTIEEIILEEAKEHHFILKSKILPTDIPVLEKGESKNMEEAGAEIFVFEKIMNEMTD
jgi:hypothetical protein